MSGPSDLLSSQQTTGHASSSGSSQPIQVIGFDVEQPQGAIIPRRRSSASSQNRTLIRSLAKASSSASTPTIPQGMPTDDLNEATSPSALPTTVHHVQPRKAKTTNTQPPMEDTSAPMLEPPVSPAVVELSSGSEAGGSSCPSGYRSGSDGVTAYGPAYSTAPTSVNNTAASTPAHGALSSKFPPKTQQSPALGNMSNPSALSSEPYAVPQAGASRLAQAAVANMVKRGMAIGQGNYNAETDGEDHPLSEKALSKRGYQSHILFNHVFHLENRWSGLRELGQGAYGLVISAQDSLSGETIAIKMLTRVFDKAILARRCLREITLLRHLNGHENITGLIDLDVVIDDFNEIYMFIEPMEADLHQIIRSGQQLSNSHIQYFLYQILRGMKYIHSANVIHRDLKPGNLLVNADCELKICDFGLARGFKPDPTEWDPNSQGPGGPMTEYVATRWYRAPEIMLSYKRYSTGIDVWSIGCILAELLGGKPIFKGKDYIEQLNLILQTLGMPDDATLTAIGSEKACAYIRTLPVFEKVPFEKLYPDADPEALDLLEKLLRFDPAERISVAEALKHPYMAPYHDETDEPDCPTVFDKWEQVEGAHTLDEFKDIILAEVEEFRKEVRTVEEWEGQSDAETRKVDAIDEVDVIEEEVDEPASPTPASEWEQPPATVPEQSAISTPEGSRNPSLQGTPRGSVSHAQSSPSPAKRVFDKTYTTPRMAISPRSDGDRGRGSSQPPSSSTLRSGRRRSTAGLTDPFTRRPASMFGLGLGMSGMTALDGSIAAAGGAAGEGPGISASLPRSHGKRASISGDLEHRFSKSRTTSTSSAVRPLVRTLSSLSMADLPLIHHQNTADPPPMSVSPADAPPSETREAVNRLAILAEHSVGNLQANEQHVLYEPETPGQHHDLNAGREHEAHHQQIEQEHEQQHHMDPELHDPQQQQQHLPPSMTDALDQQNLDEQHLRHAEGLLSFANENVGNEYYASQSDNLSRMLEAQTVDTLGAEGANDLESGAHAGGELDENGYPLDPGLNGSLYSTQEAQHAALMAGEHGGHMMDGVDGMDDYHSAGSSGMRMDHSGRKRKRTTKESSVPAEAVKLKKDVHKEVERKRRAVINDGVAAIAAVLPTNEKQKGMILAQAAQYIRQLQENERINTNSWAEEKGMLEQDIADLRSQLQHTQARLEQEHAHFERIDLAWREAEERAANLQSELERLRRRLAGGDVEGDGSGDHHHPGGEHDPLDETMDNNEDFAIETAEGLTEAQGEASPEHGAHGHGHGEQLPGVYAHEN